MTKKRKTTKTRRATSPADRHRTNIMNQLVDFRDIHTQQRRTPGVITLRDNCKLYTNSNQEQLEKYLKEKGLI